LTILPGVWLRGRWRTMPVDLGPLLEASSTVVLAVMALREVRAMRAELQADRAAVLSMLQQLAARIDSILGPRDG